MWDSRICFSKSRIMHRPVMLSYRHIIPFGSILNLFASIHNEFHVLFFTLKSVCIDSYYTCVDTCFLKILQNLLSATHQLLIQFSHQYFIQINYRPKQIITEQYQLRDLNSNNIHQRLCNRFMESSSNIQNLSYHTQHKTEANSNNP